MDDSEKTITAALYARVSSDRQDVDLSVAAQLRALRDFAERNGYRVVREYVDEAESGRVADRPQFRKMLDEASEAESPFREILVWKFSRFTRKREHAVAFKSMLGRRGIRVTSITEHADDTPTGKLMEAIIESVNEFYSENLAQEVRRGMRESAQRGFYLSSVAPFGYRKVYVADGGKQRPRLELDPPRDAVVRRIFEMALRGQSILEIVKTLNAEGIPSAKGKRWLKTAIHGLLSNEVYKGTLVWGPKAKDGSEPVRVENAVPAIVAEDEFEQVRGMLEARAPAKSSPRRAASPYLLSGLVACAVCGKQLTAAEAKGGRYSYCVCGSLLKRGSGSCETPRLNAKRFETLILDQLRDHVLTENNIRELVKMLDEEMDGAAREERDRLEMIETELREIRQMLDRIWRVIEKTDLEVDDDAPRIREHMARKEQLETAAEQARSALAERRALLDKAEVVAEFVADMADFLRTSDITESKAFLRTFIKEIGVEPAKAVIHYTIPMPEDSPIGRKDAAEVALAEGVRSSVRDGGLDSRNVRGTRSRQLLRHLDHTESVHGFLAALAEQARERSWELAQLDPPQRASRYFRLDGKLYSIQPDAFGVLRCDGRDQPFFLEWERRAIRPSTMAKRLAPYLRYYSSRRPFVDHGAPPIVLVAFDERLAADHFRRIAHDETRRSGVDLPMRISDKESLARLVPNGPAWYRVGSKQSSYAFGSWDR